MQNPQQNLANPIAFETPHVRNFYELNVHSIQERTPSTKKMQLFRSPFFSSKKKSREKVQRDLFAELLESDHHVQQQQQYQLQQQQQLQQQFVSPFSKLKHSSERSRRIGTSSQQTALITPQFSAESSCKGKSEEAKQQYALLQRQRSSSPKYSTSTTVATTAAAAAATAAAAAAAAATAAAYQEQQSQMMDYSNACAELESYDSHDSGDDKLNPEVRKRKRKNNQQLQILKIEFEKGGGYFNKEKILRVAKITGLSESQVYKWCWDQKKKRMESYKRVIRNQQVQVNRPLDFSCVGGDEGTACSASFTNRPVGQTQFLAAAVAMNCYDTAGESFVSMPELMSPQHENSQQQQQQPENDCDKENCMEQQKQVDVRQEDGAPSIHQSLHKPLRLIASSKKIGRSSFGDANGFSSNNGCKARALQNISNLMHNTRTHHHSTTSSGNPAAQGGLSTQYGKLGAHSLTQSFAHGSIGLARKGRLIQ